MKKIYFFLLLLMTFTVNVINAQSYYVSSSSLNLRSEPNVSSEVIKKLAQYDNLVVSSDSIQSSDWIKIRIDSYEGYVYKRYIKKGKANVYTYQVRTGARCNDGTYSSATGRGACSHHGGVNYWITKSRKSVNISSN